MKKLLLTALFITVLILSGCSLGQASKDTTADSLQSTGSSLESGQLTYYPTYDSQYKTAKNEVFEFWFDIPSNWNAAGDQKDGKEFTITPDSGIAELKVYGTDKKGTDDDFYKTLSGGSDDIKDITFTDGFTGKRIQNGSKIYFIRTDGDTYICFSLDYKDDTQWYKDNIDKLDHIAKSLRTEQGSLGDIGSGNKITLEELQLGALKLNTSYEQVVSAMKSEPVDVQSSSENGIDGKTLFFADDTQVYLADGLVNSIDVTDSSYKTPRGLKVGDSEARVRELYGEPDNINDSTHWGYTYDGYELFSIVFKDGKVAELEVDLVM